MKKLILLLLATASFGAEVKDENPGMLDDPACRALVVAQIKAQNQMVSDWDISYFATKMLPDGKGAGNIYHLVNHKNGQVWEVWIVLHSAQLDEKGI